MAEERSPFDWDLDTLLNAQIQSVSRFAEPLNESVVPVTVIDAETIARSSAQTLKDLLITYVPGMAFVQDQNEVNVAMRGVYASSQQKILVMLEGHRLNSRVISSANPDHAISLDKIQQIEILRGPGSASYGNVALTAVINIILKKEQSQPLSVRVAAGNFGQQKLDLLWTRRWSGKVSSTSWLYYYQNDGERVSISPENDYARAPAAQPVDAIINGFFDKPAYDVGIKVYGDNWSLLANRRFAHYVEPFSSATLTGEAYSYEDYERIKGIGPGASYRFLHLAYSHQLDITPNIKLDNEIYFDRSDMLGTLVSDPASQSFGQAQFYDRNYGFTSRITNELVWGQFLIGYEFDKFEVDNSAFPIGTGGTFTGYLFDNNNPLVRPGTEWVHSAFAVVKYHFNNQWLFNLGARFDRKHRLTLKPQTNTSPRLGAVYQPDDYFNLKLSYGESFVDAPYWNRYGALPTFRGSESLKPERLKSLQITPSWHDKKGRWSYELNLYVNRVSDFVFRNNAAAANEPINTNAGQLDTWGLEHQLIVAGEKWQARLVATMNRLIDSKQFLADDTYIYNIPNHTLNLILDYRFNDHWSINGEWQYIGKQLSPIDISLNGQPVSDPFPNSGVDYQVPNNMLDAVNLLHTRLAWQASPQLELALEVRNLFDKQWRQGGTTLHPYPQEGRWWQLAVEYRW